jgi:hypothetical protein
MARAAVSPASGLSGRWPAARINQKKVKELNAKRPERYWT